MNINYEKVRQKMYADSPYDLASRADNFFRNGVDYVIAEIQRLEREGING